MLDFDNRICYLCFIKDNKNTKDNKAQLGANVNAKQFVSLVQTSPIEGYLTEQSNQKKDWLKSGKAILKKLAKELELPDSSYDIRVNPAGPAVSGDIILHGEWLYVHLSQYACDCSNFMWRTCKGRKDYTGGANRWEQWEKLLDLPELATTMNKLRFHK